jgi:hypothetical protein
MKGGEDATQPIIREFQQYDQLVLFLFFLAQSLAKSDLMCFDLSLRTIIPLRFKPEVIACACIYMAARILQVPLPEDPAPWWELFDATKADILSQLSLLLSFLIYILILIFILILVVSNSHSLSKHASHVFLTTIEKIPFFFLIFFCIKLDEIAWMITEMYKLGKAQDIDVEKLLSAKNPHSNPEMKKSPTV